MIVNQKIKGFLIHSLTLAMHMNIEYEKTFGSAYVYNLEDITTWVYYKNMLGELHDIQKTEKKGFFRPPTIKLKTGEILPLTKEVLNSNPEIKKEYMEFGELYDSIVEDSKLSLYCKAICYDITPDMLESKELTILGYPDDIFIDNSGYILDELQSVIYKFGYKWLNSDMITIDDNYIHFFFVSLYSYIHKFLLSNEAIRTDGITASRYMKEIKINSFRFLGKHIFPLNDTSINWLANNIDLLYEYTGTDKLLYYIENEVFRPSGYSIKTLYNMDDSFQIFNNKPIYTNKKHIFTDGKKSNITTASEILHYTKDEILPSMENLLQNNTELDKRRLPIIDKRVGQRLRSRYLIIDRIDIKSNKDISFAIEYMIYTTNAFRNKEITLDLSFIGKGVKEVTYKDILANILAIYSKYGDITETIKLKYILDRDKENDALQSIPDKYRERIKEKIDNLYIGYDLGDCEKYLPVFRLMNDSDYTTDTLSILYTHKVLKAMKVDNIIIDDKDELISYGINNPIIDTDIKSIGVLLSIIWNMPDATNEDTNALKEFLMKIVSYATIVVTRPTVTNLSLPSPKENIVANLNRAKVVSASYCKGYLTEIKREMAVEYDCNPPIITYDVKNDLKEADINIYANRYIAILKEPKIIELS